MGIYHDVVVGSTFDGMLVVVDFNLAVVVFATWNDVAHISAFHGIVSIVTHKLVGTIHVLLVVHYRRRGLVVHDEFHASAMRIVVERLDVEVGIGSQKVEYLFLGVSAPVLPANVPAFDEHGIKPVVGGKVDMPTYVGIVGAMFARRCCLGIIGQSKFHRWVVVGICPFAFARNHLPPHADILHRMDPTGILDLAGLVEVEDEVRGQYLAGIVGDEGCTPRRNQRSLQPSLLAKCIGSEPGGEDETLGVEVEVHGRVVDQSCLVEVDVDAIVGLELQRGLDARFGEEGLREVLADGIVEIPADFAETRTCVIVFLRVVVTWNPPSRVVACHGEFGAFFRNDEVVELAFLWELVTQSEAIIIDAETDVHIAVFGSLCEAYQ